MKKVLFVLMYMCLISVSQAATVEAAFEAEDDSFYYQAGANWTTVEDEAALNGECITATVNTPPQTDENMRFYSFPMSAGTYHLFIRLNITAGGGDDDSLYISNDSLAEDAGTIDFNGINPDDEIEGNPIEGAGNFGWVRVRQSYVDPPVYRTYVMAADGTAYLKAGPREDGLNVDAFAFVPEADAETVTGAELTQAVIDSHFRRGTATDPVPSNDNTEVDSETTTAVSWSAPVDPNIASISGYDVYFGTDPNIIASPSTFVATESLPVTLDYATPYHWRVDTHIVWDSNDISGTGSFSQTVEGVDWTFTTLPDDKVPVVVCADDILTSLELLPAGLTGTVDDYGEGDIASILWEVLGTSAAEAAKQMVTRGQDLSSVTADPNLLMDWIGTDTRQVGNPLYLSLKGLPAGTYDWTSYHHDAQDQHGVFDVTVFDASGSAKTTNIVISSGNTPPAKTVPLTITSNGTDDVVLVFDLQDATEVALQFFLMNGFDLTDGVSVDPLYIDFGSTDANNLMTGYQLYQAQHEVESTFTEQSYSAFGTTVSILPTWGGLEATVTDTTNDPSSATQTANLTTEWPGAYLVQLSATDNAAQTGSDTMVVTVAADACTAAQLSPSWAGYHGSDINKDCIVNLEDFASIAAEWLDDRNLTAQE